MNQQPMNQIQTDTMPTLTYNGFIITTFPRIMHQGRETYYQDIVGPSYTQDNTSQEIRVHRIYFDNIDQYNTRHRDAMRRFFQPVYTNMERVEDQYIEAVDRAIIGPPEVPPKQSLQMIDPILQDAFVRENVNIMFQRGVGLENAYMNEGLIADHQPGVFGNSFIMPRYIVADNFLPDANRVQQDNDPGVPTVNIEQEQNPQPPIVFPPQFPPGAGRNLRDEFDRSGSGGL